jgi:hypothetical protein
MANTTVRGAEAIHGQNPQVFALFFDSVSQTKIYLQIGALAFGRVYHS